MTSDPAGGRQGCQDEKVEHHEQVVGDDSGGDQIFAGPRRIGHGDQVDGAADIGADKHGHRRLRRRPQDIFQQQIGQDTACRCPQAPQKEDSRDPAALPPDLAEIRLKEKKGDGQGHQIGPDEIIGRRLRRDDPEVGQGHGKNQTEDTGGYLRRPLEALLEPDGDRRDHDQDGKEHPGIIC